MSFYGTSYNTSHVFSITTQPQSATKQRQNPHFSHLPGPKEDCSHQQKEIPISQEESRVTPLSLGPNRTFYAVKKCWLRQVSVEGVVVIS